MEVTVKNMTRSPIFVNAVDGAKTLPAGQEGTAEFSDGEFASMKRNPGLQLTVDGQVVSGGGVQAAATQSRPAPVWGEGNNEAGSPKKSNEPAKLTKKQARDLEMKRAEAQAAGVEITDDMDADAIQAAIDAKSKESQ